MSQYFIIPHFVSMSFLKSLHSLKIVYGGQPRFLPTQVKRKLYTNPKLPVWKSQASSSMPPETSIRKMTLTTVKALHFAPASYLRIYRTTAHVLLKLRFRGAICNSSVDEVFPRRNRTSFYTLGDWYWYNPTGKFCNGVCSYG